MDSQAKAVLEGLDEEQLEAVTAAPGPVRILAGAGTGKTRSVTHRIAYHHLLGTMPAHTVLAVTHSAKAASEMRERLTHLGVPRAQARTFHAAALRQLRHFWARTGLPGNGPNIVSDNRSLIRLAAAEAARVHRSQVESTTVLTLAAEVGWAHAQRVTPASYARAANLAGRTTELGTAYIAEAYRLYEALKREQQVLDFDDIVSQCAVLLETDPVVASAVREGYRSFVVDEYQDTDPAQQRLLDAWLGDRDTVCVVGDPTQSIYYFRGADQKLLVNFNRKYPHATSVSLVRDYRSTPQIVEAANKLAAGTGSAALRLIGQQPDGPEVVEHACETEDDEVTQIATAVAAAVKAGTPVGEIAVLHRYNSQAPAIRAGLSQAGVPVDVDAGDTYFDAPEIRRVLVELSASVTHEPNTDALVLLREALDACGFDAKNPPEGVGAARMRWENQKELLNMSASLHKAGVMTGQALLDELRRRAEAEHTPAGARGVTVTTIHKSKGLEWDMVVVARATVGSMPSAFATTDAEKAEERRLAYVACTRARTTLVWTWAKGRDGKKLKRSPYLDTVVGPYRPPLSRPPTPTPSRPRVVFTVGQQVLHDSHGLGRVTAVTGAVIYVDFGSLGNLRVMTDREPISPM